MSVPPSPLRLPVRPFPLDRTKVSLPVVPLTLGILEKLSTVEPLNVHVARVIVGDVHRGSRCSTLERSKVSLVLPPVMVPETLPLVSRSNVLVRTPPLRFGTELKVNGTEPQRSTIRPTDGPGGHGVRPNQGRVGAADQIVDAADSTRPRGHRRSQVHCDWGGVARE